MSETVSSTADAPGKIVCAKPVGKDGKDGLCDKKLNHPSGCSNEATRQKNRGKKRKSRTKQRNEIAAGAIKRDEAFEILAARGVKHPHIQDVVYRHLLYEAETHGIPSNRFLFENGLVKTLASQAGDEEQKLEPISSDYIAGELLTRAELHALYDAAWATHEPATFEQFLEFRLACKKDVFILGRDFLGMEGFAECHQVWADFFPHLNPTALPPNYTLKQATEWLASQSETIKDFLLMASRRAYKSTFMRVWLASMIVTFPDVRILIVSETRPLSKDNIEALRGFFEHQPGIENPYIRFQRLFPEHTIPMGDGSVLSLESPMRRLRLPQSVESSSMDSTVAGRRSDVILFDDPISDVSCTNDTQIAKSVQKRDLLVKLKNKGGIVITLGTPWHHNDLYAQMIARAKKNHDETFDYRIDPAFEVKAEFEFKLTPMLLPILQESDIATFLMPDNLSWKDLRPDMLNNPAFFLSQNLCLFPKAEDEGLRVQFDPDQLRLRWKPAAFFGENPAAQIVMALDRAFSQSRYADYSCVAVAKVQLVESKMAMVIHDVKMDRYKESDLVRAIVDLIERHRPTIFVAEKDRSWETLAYAIRQLCLMRGIAPPFMRWRDVANSDNAKARRVKSLELPISDGRFWFTQGRVTEDHLRQLEIFDGVHKSNSSRKDDFCDTCAILWENFGPKYEQETKPEDHELREQQLEEEAAAARRQEHINRLFPSYGGTRLHPQPSDQSGQMKLSEWYRTKNNPGGTPPAPEPEPPKSNDPRDAVFGYKKFISGGNRIIFGATGKWKQS